MVTLPDSVPRLKPVSENPRPFRWRRIKVIGAPIMHRFADGAGSYFYESRYPKYAGDFVQGYPVPCAGQTSRPILYQATPQTGSHGQKDLEERLKGLGYL